MFDSVWAKCSLQNFIVDINYVGLFAQRTLDNICKTRDDTDINISVYTDISHLLVHDSLVQHIRTHTNCYFSVNIGLISLFKLKCAPFFSGQCKSGYLDLAIWYTRKVMWQALRLDHHLYLGCDWNSEICWASWQTLYLEINSSPRRLSVEVPIHTHNKPI